MKKRIITTFLSLSLTLGVSATARAAVFRDVPEDHWAARYIEDAALCGYVEGMGGGLFKPEGRVTYGEFAAMTARALFSGELSEEAGGDWYEPYVELCTKKGVFENTALMTGADADTPMTRCELAMTIDNALRAAGARGPELRELLLVSVPDMNEYTTSQREAIRAVYALGVMNGCDGNGTFCGGDTMTRAQAAAVLMRMSGVEPDPEPSAPETPELPAPVEPENPDSEEPEDTEPEPSAPAGPDSESPAPAEPEPENPGPELPDPEGPERKPQAPEDPEPETPGSNSPVPAEPEPEDPGPETPEPDMDARQRAAYEAIIAMKERYPEGTRWTNENSYAWRGGIYNVGYGCSGFAFLLSDAAFGEARARMVRPVRLEEVRVGDILRINGDTHSVVALEVREDSVIIAEGNYNSCVHWGRELPRRTVESASYLLTRYD